MSSQSQPHDQLSFEELAQRYNFERTSRDSSLFARLVRDECRRAASAPRVLDVGCRHGIANSADDRLAIRQVAGELWGVEPDTRVEVPAGEFHRFQHATLEEADLPADYFDVVYSWAVMEHVARPEAFLQALGRCLKPGGVYLFGTPNARHYFGRAARWTHRLGLDELLLRGLRRPGGYDYHYPLEYRFNEERVIERLAAEQGFRAEFAYVEARGPESYLRGPLRPIFWVLAWKRRWIRNPRHLLLIFCRMTKVGG